MLYHCRDCETKLNLTPQQANYQAMVQGRRSFKLCGDCGVIDSQKKWDTLRAIDAQVADDLQALTKEHNRYNNRRDRRLAKLKRDVRRTTSAM